MVHEKRVDKIREAYSWRFSAFRSCLIHVRARFSAQLSSLFCKHTGYHHSKPLSPDPSRAAIAVAVRLLCNMGSVKHDSVRPTSL